MTEWTLGLGQRCGNAVFASQRMQSFVAVAQAALVDGALRIVIADDGGAATEATLDLRGVTTAGRRLIVRWPRANPYG